MNLLTNVFYLISTALLIPVMLILLATLVQVLLVLGQTVREFLVRCRNARTLAEYSEVLGRNQGDLPGWSSSASTGLLPETLSRLEQTAADPVLAEKLAADAEMAWRDEVERITGLARRGPALGLMGTLIPLGPALVGLAAGNLQMMSENLVIAFATTVVGLLVGTLAGTIVGTKKRWYRADAALVGFALSRVLSGTHSSKNAAKHNDRHPAQDRSSRHAVASTGGNHHAKAVESHLQAQTAEAH